MRIERSRNPRMQLAIKCNALEHDVSRSNRYCTVKGLLKTSEEHESGTLRSLLKCQHCSNKTAWRKLVPSPGETARLQCFLPAPEILYTSLLGKQNCFQVLFQQNLSFFSSTLIGFLHHLRPISPISNIWLGLSQSTNVFPSPLTLLLRHPLLASRFIFIFKTNASRKHVEYI